MWRVRAKMKVMSDDEDDLESSEGLEGLALLETEHSCLSCLNASCHLPSSSLMALQGN